MSKTHSKGFAVVNLKVVTVRRRALVLVCEEDVVQDAMTLVRSMPAVEFTSQVRQTSRSTANELHPTIGLCAAAFLLEFCGKEWFRMGDDKKD